jgi:hypothetical protein
MEWTHLMTTNSSNSSDCLRITLVHALRGGNSIAPEQTPGVAPSLHPRLSAAFFTASIAMHQPRLL